MGHTTLKLAFSQKVSISAGENKEKVLKEEER